MSSIGVISGMSALEIARKIEDLEQQLSNSTPNAAIRELIGSYESFYEHCYRCGDSRQHDLIEDLNKLLEGDNNG